MLASCVSNELASRSNPAPTRKFWRGIWQLQENSALHLESCLLTPSAEDHSNIILEVPRSNHKEWGKFKDNVIKKKKKKAFGEDDE